MRRPKSPPRSAPRTDLAVSTSEAPADAPPTPAAPAIGFHFIRRVYDASGELAG